MRSEGTQTDTTAERADRATPPHGGIQGADAGASERLSRYQSYIRSDAWRRSPARLEEIALAEGRCRLCGRGAPHVRIEVHHRDYVRLGCERAADLCTVCRECHEIVTDALRRRRFATLTLPQLRDTPRVLPDRVLADERS